MMPVGPSPWRAVDGPRCGGRVACGWVRGLRPGASRFRWTRSLRADDLRRALGCRGVSCRILCNSRCSSVEPVGVCWRCKSPVPRRQHQWCCGWIRSAALRTLPSTLFVLESVGPQHWLVRGGGFGHGAGLSQAGAIDLARQGWPVERILSHYYPGAVYGPLPQSLESP